MFYTSTLLLNFFYQSEKDKINCVNLRNNESGANKRFFFLNEPTFQDVCSLFIPFARLCSLCTHADVTHCYKSGFHHADRLPLWKSPINEWQYHKNDSIVKGTLTYLANSNRNPWGCQVSEFILLQQKKWKTILEWENWTRINQFFD